MLQRMANRKMMNTLVEVRNYNGAPALFINGKPKFGGIYMFDSTDKALKYLIKEFSQADVHIYSFVYPFYKYWKREGGIEFNAFAKVVEKILMQDKEAYIIPRVSVTTPEWWDKEHPEELIVYDVNKINPKLFKTAYSKWESRKGGDGYKQPSYASELWRKESSKRLIQLVNCIQNSKWGNRVIGYHIAHGICGEWLHYGAPFERWFCADFSKPMLKSFHQRLRSKYKDVSQLRKTWNDSTVTFETANIPTREQRLRTDLLTFMNPKTKRQIFDYYQHLALLSVENIEHFARIVKEATDERVLCGVFYNYLLGAWHDTWTQHAGHLAADRLLDSKYIDFIAAPYIYMWSEPGIGDCNFWTCTGSIKIRNKLFISEADQRTFLGHPPYKYTDNLHDSIEVLKRDFVRVMIGGYSQWWYDFGSGWFSHPQLLSTIKRCMEIGRESMEKERQIVDGWAAVVDEESYFYQKLEITLTTPLLGEQINRVFGRVGAPWETYLHNDLPSARSAYRMYFFLNTFYLTEEERRIIKGLQKDNNVLVWIYAPGFLCEDGFSLSAIKELTGINLKYEEISMPLRISIVDSSHPILAGLKPSHTAVFGCKQPVGPIFYVDDPEAETLGMVSILQKPGFAVKNMGNWTSVYLSAPLSSSMEDPYLESDWKLPIVILRNICKLAGIHIYCEDNALIYVNKNYLSLHTREEGVYNVELPKHMDVFDLFNKRFVGRNINKFREYLPAKTTMLYALGV